MPEQREQFELARVGVLELVDHHAPEPATQLRGDRRTIPEEVAGHGPIAYEYGLYSLDLGGNGRDRGKYLRVLRNTAGTWRVEKTIWSSDLPPSAAHAN